MMYKMYKPSVLSVINPNPDCERADCVFRHMGTETTLIGWTHSYDKHGNLINDDPNILTEIIKCSSCDTTFRVKKQYGRVINTQHVTVKEKE